MPDCRVQNIQFFRMDDCAPFGDITTIPGVFSPTMELYSMPTTHHHTVNSTPRHARVNASVTIQCANNLLFLQFRKNQPEKEEQNNAVSHLNGTIANATQACCLYTRLEWGKCAFSDRFPSKREKNGYTMVYTAKLDGAEQGSEKSPLFCTCCVCSHVTWVPCTCKMCTSMHFMHHENTSRYTTPLTRHEELLHGRRGGLPEMYWWKSTSGRIRAASSIAPGEIYTQHTRKEKRQSTTEWWMSIKNETKVSRGGGRWHMQRRLSHTHLRTQRIWHPARWYVKVIRSIRAYLLANLLTRLHKMRRF